MKPGAATVYIVGIPYALFVKSKKQRNQSSSMLHAFILATILSIQKFRPGPVRK